MASLEKTENALRRFPSPSSEWHWAFTILKADILHRQGLDTESLALLETELPPALANSEFAVRRKLAQGVASAFMQHLPDADRYLAEAETLAKGHHPELLGEVVLKKGTVRFLAGDASKAEMAYRTALQIAREAKDQFLEASALEGLGLVATRNEHYDEAIDWNRAAVELARTVSAKHSLAQSLGNTGWSYVELGDYETALGFYNQAEEVSAESGLAGDQTYWLTSIAYVQHALRDYAAAEAILNRALVLAQKQDDKNTLAQCLNQLTEIALETGRIKLADRYNREVQRFQGTGLDPALLLDATLFQASIAQSSGHFGDAEQWFRQVLSDPAADSSRKWIAQAGLASVLAAEGANSRAEKEFLHALATIEAARSSVRTEEFRLSFLSKAISFYDDFIDFLIAQHREDDALQVAELSRSRTLAEGLGTSRPKTLSFPLPNFHPQRIAQRLQATLLFYWLGRERSILWLIGPSKTAALPLPGAALVLPAIKSYRRALLENRDILATRNQDGANLFALLVEPVRVLLPPGSRVILLPDASLYGLNFETFVVPAPQPHYWIEDVALTTASSLTLLAAAANRPLAKERSLLLIGDALPVQEFEYLPQAPAEIDRIVQYFPEQTRTVLRGKEATPEGYIHSDPARFSHIHFVTHGTASRSRPLESAVILSPDGNSYKLYAREIVKHRLNANLVTISACNGSGSAAYSGEGLVGLSWAFLRAGAHNVIGALWEVSDASTPQLMDKMYSELAAGKDPATALRAAKLSLLHSNTAFKKPYYWAPFQLYTGS